MTKIELINNFYPYAKQIEQAHGVPVFVSLGMLILEVGYDLKTVGTNNFFNMKAPSSYTGSVTVKEVREFVNNVWTTQVSRFVNFANVQDCFNAFAMRLKTLWSTAFSYSDPVQFVSVLVSGKKKYATDPDYVKKFKSVLASIQGVSIDMFSPDVLGVVIALLIPMVLF